MSCHNVSRVQLVNGFVIAVLLCRGEARLNADEKPLFSDGDRVVLLGATLIERMQDSSYVETELIRRLGGKEVKFRNLGWSGDTVGGVSRAVFGQPADGFARLLRDVKTAQPTVVVLCYGGNEAHAGKGGLKSFRQDAVRLLDALAALDVRIVVMSPIPQEPRPAPFPSPVGYNEQLQAYVGVLRTLSSERDYPFVDLGAVAREVGGRLTDNGVHPGDTGYWLLAPRLAAGLSVDNSRWAVDLQVSPARQGPCRGVSVKGVELTPARVTFEATSERLPRPPAPRGAADAPTRMLRVRGLQAGKYTIRVDGKPWMRTDANALAKGLQVTGAWEWGQVEAMRAEVIAKNKLYFHRYRPQNETYLFLFRKREQGNNAVEIPQFDPLVATKEKQIRELNRPRPHRFEILAD